MHFILKLQKSLYPAFKETSVFCRSCRYFLEIICHILMHVPTSVLIVILKVNLGKLVPHLSVFNIQSIVLFI